jgi:hypothetical protein
MERARRHQRLLSVLAFGLLALAAELAGGSLTHRIDVGRHVANPSYAHDAYFPFLLAGVKFGIALLLARLVWRIGKARATERAAHRLLAAGGILPEHRAPRVRLTLSPRLWLAVFGLTSSIYLVQTDAEGHATLFHPWLHSSALPVFAVLAVAVAFAWGVVQRWLAEYERYAERTAAQAALRAPSPARLAVQHAAEASAATPRRLFGLAFESRPPPLAA